MNYIYENKHFTPVESIPNSASEIQMSDLGLHQQSRYLFYKNWDTDEAWLGEVFVRNYLDKSTPPYSAIILGVFLKHGNTIYFDGGFSIC